MKTEKLTYEKAEEGIKKIIEQINNSPLYIDSVYGIPRGGWYLATRLSHLLKLPCISSIGNIGKNTLVCDDISDTGETLLRFKKGKFATLYYKKTSKVKPQFYAFNTTKWVDFFWEEK